MVIKELIETPTWDVLDNNKWTYTVNMVYRNYEGNLVFGLTKLDSGFYEEFDLIEFYRCFRYKI